MVKPASRQRLKRLKISITVIATSNFRFSRTLASQPPRRKSAMLFRFTPLKQARGNTQ